MPIHECQEGGKPGHQWGEQGTCDAYTPGDPVSREAAHARANGWVEGQSGKGRRKGG